MAEPIYHPHVADWRFAQALDKVDAQARRALAHLIDESPIMNLHRKGGETGAFGAVKWAEPAPPKWEAHIPLPQPAGITDQEIAEHQAWVDQETARREMAVIEQMSVVRAYLDLDDEVAHLHSPDEHGKCEGDEFEGWEAEAPEWPCSTAITVARVHGVPLFDRPVDYREVVKRVREDG